MLFSAESVSATVGLSSNCDFDLLTRHFPNCAALSLLTLLEDFPEGNEMACSIARTCFR
jgi:hypothetical protein